MTRRPRVLLGAATAAILAALLLGTFANQAHAGNYNGIYTELQSPDCTSGHTCGTRTSSGTTATYSNFVVSSSGSNHYIVVGVTINKASSSGCSLTASYNGTSLSQIGRKNAVSNYCAIALFGGVVSSGLGSGHNVVGTTDCSSSDIAVTAVSFTYVNGSSLGTFSSATGTSTTMTVSPSTSEAQMVIDMGCVVASAANASITTPSSPRNQIWASTHGSDYGRSTASHRYSTDNGSSTAMSYTVGGTSIDWAIGAFAVKPATGSRIQLDNFAAFGTGNDVRLDWRTGSEIDNLGFHVWRDDGGGRVRVTPTPILGSAFLVGGGISVAGGRRYTLDDFLAPSTGARARYWLEDLALDGRRTWHGPIQPTALPAASTVALLSRAHGTVLQKTIEPEAVVEPPYTVPAATSSDAQFALASGNAVKIGIDRDGYYELTGAELTRAGLDPTTDPRTLGLAHAGVPIPIDVQGSEDGQLDAGDRIGFHGQRLHAATTDTRVYWLSGGSQPLRIPSVTPPPGAPAGPATTAATLEWRPRAIYFAALTNGDDDNFFGPLVGPTPVEQILVLTDAAPGPLAIEVGLQGVSRQPHAVRLSVNGVEVGSIRLDGQARASSVLSVPAGTPLDGRVAITLTASGAADTTLVDFVRAHYRRPLVASHGRLAFESAPGRSVTLTGFAPQARVRLLDATTPEAPSWLPLAKASGAGGVTVIVPGATNDEPRSLIALDDGIASSPRLVAANQPSQWNRPDQGGDLVVIGPATLLPSFAPLAERRRAEGWTVASVDIEDVYDEFSFGIKQPDAIRAFLSRAATVWKRRPRAVILLGDATFDPRDRLGKGPFDLVPTKLVATETIETASDDWFTDFNDDGIADIPIGRLPVRGLAESVALIKKLLAAPSYGSESAATSAAPLVFVAGNADDKYDFPAVSRSLRERVGAPFRTVGLEQDLAGATRTTQLREALRQRPALVGFTGHGSQEVWEGGLLDAATVATLGDEGPGAFWMDLTCLNGFFQDAHRPSLAEALLTRETGGAFGIWASSAITEVQWHGDLGRTFLDELISRGATVGEAAQRAKAFVPDMDTRRSWILFGDPTWRLRRFSPTAPPDAGADAGAKDAGPLADGGAVDGSAPKSIPDPSGQTGCACDVGSSGDGAPLFSILLGLIGVGLARRRRSR